AQLLVAEHAGQELGALGRTHRGHHAQFVLAGEVRVEEFVVAHPEPATKKVGDSADRRRYWRRGSVEIDLGVVQTARNEIPVAAELEVEIDFYGRARAGTVRSNRVARAARSRHPVQ